MRKIVAGNALIGDTLLLWPLLSKTEPSQVICTPRNLPAVAVLRDVVGFNIPEVVVVTEEGREANQLGGYDEWREQHGHTDGMGLRDTGHGTDLIAMQPFPRTDRLRSFRVTLQLESEHTWKNIRGIEEGVRACKWVDPAGGQYGLATCALPTQQRTLGRVIRTSLPQVATELAVAALHVGISSSITLLAYLMGTPTIMCCPGGWNTGTWDYDPTLLTILHDPTPFVITACMNQIIEERYE